jgi:hypothetical protein
MFATFRSVLFQFLQDSWVTGILTNPFSENPHTKYRVGSGDRGGQRPLTTMRSPKNSCSKAVVFAMWAVAPSTLRSVSPVNTVRRRTCFLSQALPVSHYFVTSRCAVVLFSTSLSGYALLNASRTAANDFDMK